MYKYLLLLSLLVPAISAQETPKAEVFGGYEYANEAQFVGGHRASLHGWNGSVGVNLNRWFGVVTDFSGVYGTSHGSTVVLVCNPTCSPMPVTVAENAKLHTFLFGPQFSLRANNWVAFGHMLLGGQRENVTATLGPVPVPPGGFQLGPGIRLRGVTAFELAVGGGVDYNIGRNLAWRLQSDYLALGAQNNVRISSGIVFRFGQ
jgi:hypothetical protein